MVLEQAVSLGSSGGCGQSGVPMSILDELQVGLVSLLQTL